MESKINYTLVGLFVVLLLTGLIAFAFWLVKHGGKQEYDYYTVFMSESVAGLSNDASVKYRGVEVGTVEHIGLNPDNSEQVKLLLKIQYQTPVKVDTTATLKSFGLTGLAYVELEGGSRNAPLLKATEDGIPTIPSRPSIFTRIDESLSQLSAKSSVALDKFELLLSEQNLQNIEEILVESKQLAKDVRGQLPRFKEFIEKSVVMEQRITRAFQKVEVASVSVNKMAYSIEKNYADVGRNLSQDVRQSLESLNQLLFELNVLTGHMQKTIKNFEASPTDLIFKRSQPKLGPGEKEYNEK